MHSAGQQEGLGRCDTNLFTPKIYFRVARRLVKEVRPYKLKKHHTNLTTTPVNLFRY